MFIFTVVNYDFNRPKLQAACVEWERSSPCHPNAAGGDAVALSPPCPAGWQCHLPILTGLERLLGHEVPGQGVFDVLELHSKLRRGGDRSWQVPVMCSWQGAGRSQGMGLGIAGLVAQHQLGIHRRVLSCVWGLHLGGWLG